MAQMKCIEANFADKFLLRRIKYFDIQRELHSTIAFINNNIMVSSSTAVSSSSIGSIVSNGTEK